jgi:putative hydrolase of the HAD superfamily
MSLIRNRCLFLDLGMVVIALERDRFERQMKDLTGLPADRLRSILMADDLPARLETGRMSGRGFFDEICQRTGKNLMWDRFSAAWNSMLGKQQLDNEFLAKLSARVRLCMVSNTNEIHFDYVRRNYDFLGHFDGCILSYEVGAAKPDFAILKRALEEMNSNPADAVFVDDQPVNVNSALELGIDAFCYVDPSHLACELQRRRWI